MGCDTPLSNLCGLFTEGVFHSSCKNIWNTFSWVISGTSSPNLACNPRHPSQNISCNHRRHLMQPSYIVTSNNFCIEYTETRVDSNINNVYKASPFDRLYMWRRKWDTAGLVRAHQRKYWNALTLGRCHDDDGCSCNHRAVSPSVFLWVRVALSCIRLEGRKPWTDYSHIYIYRWYPAKRALPAMLTHGRYGPFGRIPSIYTINMQIQFLMYVYGNRVQKGR